MWILSVYEKILRSGKSTYLQQVCLIVILAQIGCYIPARFASLRVVDRIFTRIGTGDNLEYNSSTVSMKNFRAVFSAVKRLAFCLLEFRLLINLSFCRTFFC